MKYLCTGLLVFLSIITTAQSYADTGTSQPVPDSVQKLQRISVALVILAVPEALGGSLSTLFGAKYLRGWYNRPQQLSDGQVIPKTPAELRHNRNTGIALTTGGSLLLAAVVASGYLGSHFHAQYVKQIKKLQLQTGILDSGNLGLALNL